MFQVKKKQFEYILYVIIIIAQYMLIGKPIILKYRIGNLIVLHKCCDQEMRSLSSDVDKGLEKGFKPGDLYYGSAKKNNLELELKNYGNIFPEYYIDPFFSGEFKKRISFYVPSHRNAFGYTLKRGLLKYYTDGHKKAVIISAGPDKIYEEFDYISEDPYYNIIPYDPTNGLYSKGDIIMILDTREAYPIYYNNKNNYYQK